MRALRVAARRAQSACARVAAKWLRLELAAGRGAPLVALDAAALEAHPRADYLACAVTGPAAVARASRTARSRCRSRTRASSRRPRSPRRARSAWTWSAVEARAAAFADEHFTPREREGSRARRRGRAPARAALETLLWSAKEALYKTGALALPARFSFRDIDARVPAWGRAPGAALGPRLRAGRAGRAVLRPGRADRCVRARRGRPRSAGRGSRMNGTHQTRGFDDAIS